MAAATLGVGIVGLGSIGATHARALRDVEGVEVRAVSGGAPDAAAAAGWPDAVRLPPDEVLRHPGVDVVAVCAPTQWHAPLAVAAVEAGRHVVVEKPLTTDVADAVRLAVLQRERGRLVAMVAQRRFEPEYAALKSLADAGGLGAMRLGTTHVHWYRDDAYYAAAPWRTSMAGGGGSLLNQGVHNVDLLRWLCGPVEEVTAQYATLGRDMDAEDTTVATLRFASGALGLVSTSTATPPGAPATLALHGSAGVVELGQGEVLRWDVPGVPAPSSDGHVASGAADPLAIGVAGHARMWRAIVEAIGSGERYGADAQDAVDTVRLLCGIYEAARSGTRVRLTGPSRRGTAG
ncbi:Gfo/Idh/MocA family protein [Jiangella alba]|uniref:Predicted dehydrogenase n=1 Tax=Jiangella alba TaxID=561176 RepID=A0A1H5PY92_9ACTN|nr:Gfo/Idh/MocA family oxidoreductase [Jiangella alba]SEF18832.1 Predicted dehydrogenase [Jiangella alba]